MLQEISRDITPEWRDRAKAKQHPVVDVTGDGSKVWCCKEQYCIGTWNVRSMNQGKLEVVKQEKVRVNIDIVGLSNLKWIGMGELRWPLDLLLWARIPEKKWSSHHSQQKSPKCSTWVQSQKQQNDLGSFPRKTIQYHSNPSLYRTSNSEEAEVEWFYEDLKELLEVTHTKRCPFGHRGLECKSRKSRDTWSNRQIWPRSTKWSRAKAHRPLPKNTLVVADTLFHQHKRRLYTWTSPGGQYQSQTDYILCSQRWRSFIESAKTRWGADCGSDHELFIAKFRLKSKKVGKTTRPYRYDPN